MLYVISILGLQIGISRSVKTYAVFTNKNITVVMNERFEQFSAILKAGNRLLVAEKRVAQTPEHFQVVPAQVALH